MFSISFLFLLAFLGGSRSAQVVLDQGPVRGTQLTTYGGRTIHAFLGMPYAQPPIGPNRFAEPKPPEKWEGVYDATAHPNLCMQYDIVTYMSDKPVHGSEDCLYISVYTPKLPTPGKNESLMDVVAFIHGGAFMFHFAAHHGPQYLLDNDVVHVGFTHRLGVLGFLSTEDKVIPGNNGLKDQVMALKWIQKNIAKFGGNPESVTLSGASSGGASVHFHFLSPLTKGLFKRGHSMSGTALNPWSLSDNAKEKALRIGDEVGCPTTDSQQLLSCLRTRPASRLVALSRVFMPWRYTPIAPFGPVVEVPHEGAFISEHPLDIILSGKVHDLPWLVSYDASEGAFPAAEFASDLKIIRELDQRWNELAPFVMDYNGTAPRGSVNRISETIRKHYLKDKPLENSVPELIQMFGDRLFISDLVKTAKLQAKVNNAPVYSYRFTYRGKNSLSEGLSMSKENLGASHVDDMCYIFKVDFLDATETDSDIAMMKAMVNMTVTFMATGRPRFGDDECWTEVKQSLPDFTFKDLINADLSPEETSHDVGNKEFWNSLGFLENIPSTSTK